MDWIIIIILSLFLLGYRYFRLGDFFSPWSITTIVWLGIMVLFQIESDLLYPLSNKFYTSLIIWVPIFCSSSLLSFYALPKHLKDEAKRKTEMRDISMTMFNAFFMLSVIMTPIYVYQIMKIVTMFDTTDLFYNLRYLAVNGENDFGILKYSYIINQVLFVVAVWQYPKIPGWKLLLVTIAFIMGQFALMEKNGLFLMVITMLIVLYSKNIIKLRTIFIVLAIIVIVFFLINFSKEIKSDEGAESATFLDFIGIYILSPSVAFGYVTQDLSNQFGAHTFEYFYSLLDNWGIGDYVVYERLRGYVWVPLPTNVYTIFQPFYEDFGYQGIAFFAFIYGVIMGTAYRFFKYGYFIALCIYTFLAKVMFVQFYHEDFIMSIATFGQFTILVLLISIPWKLPFKTVFLSKE